MMKDPVRKAAIISGVVLTVLGIVLLFWTQNFINGLVRWSPLAITVFGAWLLFKAWFRKSRPSNLFLGLLLFLSGTFILLLSTGILPESLGLKELWPVFMGIVGVSLIPYGAGYRRTIRVTLVIPGIILIILAAVFLVFSLGLVKQSFSEFVIGWWPLVLVFMGITLVASAAFGRKE
jgi:drug/metabolite transporter (DMT)-like permease